MSYKHVLSSIPLIGKRFGHHHQTKATAECSRQELMLEVETLRQTLADTQTALASAQTELELYKLRTRQLAETWRERLRDAEHAVEIQRQAREQELQELTAQLVFFEAQLRKEQGEIQAALTEKDHVIRAQQERLAQLERTNKELCRALTKIRQHLPEGVRTAFSEPPQLSAQSEEDLVIVAPSTWDRSLSFGEEADVMESRHSPLSRQLRASPTPLCTSSVSDVSQLPVDIDCGISDVQSWSSVHATSLKHHGSCENVSRPTPIGACNTHPRLQRSTRMVKSQPNLSQLTEEEEESKDSGCWMNSSCSSLDLPAQAPVQSMSRAQSESPRDQAKPTYLRPRDVKKKSKLRSRSVSLKDTDQKTQQKGDHKPGQAKRFFSFAF